jgi:hypothetical protein
MKNWIGWIGDAVAVALIVALTRWIIASGASELPQAVGSKTVYGVQRAVRLTGALAAGLGAVLFYFSDKHFLALLIPLGFVCLGVFMSMGHVTTDAAGVTKTSLWRTRAFRWEEISKVRFYDKPSAAIELYSGSSRMIVDSRFVGVRSLLEDVKKHTQLNPEVK